MNLGFAATLSPSAYWYLARGTGAVSLVLLLSGPDSQVVAVTLFDFWNNGQIGELAALGCVWTAIMTVFSLAFFVVARRYQLAVG